MSGSAQFLKLRVFEIIGCLPLQTESSRHYLTHYEERVLVQISFVCGITGQLPHDLSRQLSSCVGRADFTNPDQLGGRPLAAAIQFGCRKGDFFVLSSNERPPPELSSELLFVFAHTYEGNLRPSQIMAHRQVLDLYTKPAPHVGRYRIRSYILHA